MTKKYDVVAVTGTYTNNAGEEKKRYLNVGSIHDSGNGPYMFLNASFNPAGIQRKEGSDSIILSLFTPKPRDGQAQQQSRPAPTGTPGFDDTDIPF